MIFGIVAGRLVADPQTRSGQNGNFVTFDIAVNHGKKDGVDQTTFVDCTANGKTGELITQHFKKGNVLAVAAELKERAYESNGQQKKSLSADVVRIDWQASQSTQPAVGAQPAQAAPAPQGYATQPQYPPQSGGYPPQQQYQQPPQYPAQAPAPQQYAQQPYQQAAPQVYPQQQPQGYLPAGYPQQAPQGYPPQQQQLPMGNGGGRSPF